MGSISGLLRRHHPHPVFGDVVHAPARRRQVAEWALLGAALLEFILLPLIMMMMVREGTPLSMLVERWEFGLFFLVTFTGAIVAFVSMVAEAFEFRRLGSWVLVAPAAQLLLLVAIVRSESGPVSLVIQSANAFAFFALYLSAAAAALLTIYLHRDSRHN